MLARGKNSPSLLDITGSRQSVFFMCCKRFTCIFLNRNVLSESPGGTRLTSKGGSWKMLHPTMAQQNCCAHYSLWRRQICTGELTKAGVAWKCPQIGKSQTGLFFHRNFEGLLLFYGLMEKWCNTFSFFFFNKFSYFRLWWWQSRSLNLLSGSCSSH